MLTKAFWAGVAERMVRATASSLLAALAADKLDSLRSVPWEAYLTVAVVAAATSFLMSMAGSQVGPAGSPSTVYDRPNDGKEGR